MNCTPAQLARSQRYRDKNPDAHRARAKSYRNNNWLRSRLVGLIVQLRIRAKKKGVDFNLDRPYLEEMGDCCALTGIKFSATDAPGKPHMYSPSVDRLRAGEGYVKGNVRIVLFAINSFRGTGTDTEMLNIAEALLRKQRPYLFLGGK